jgi:hypothetical protein
VLLGGRWGSGAVLLSSVRHRKPLDGGGRPMRFQRRRLRVRCSRRRRSRVLRELQQFRHPAMHALRRRRGGGPLRSDVLFLGLRVPRVDAVLMCGRGGDERAFARRFDHVPGGGNASQALRFWPFLRRLKRRGIARSSPPRTTATALGAFPSSTRGRRRQLRPHVLETVVERTEHAAVAGRERISNAWVIEVLRVPIEET